MIVVQTHWSKPTRWQNQNKKLRDQLVMYALSAHTCRKAFGCPVVMVTDSAFASILSDLPKIYDAVTTELDDMTGIDPRFWAFPKFHVFAKYAPSNPWLLQIDTDVFFWDSMQIGDNVELLVQSHEDGHLYDHSYDLPVKFVDSAIKDVNAKIPFWSGNCGRGAYNCGVVGFKNGDTAKEYAINAMEICEAVAPFLDSFDDSIPQEKRKGSVMVIPEQYYLKCFADGKELYVSHVSAKRLQDGTVASFHPFDYYHMMADKTDQKMRDMVADKAQKEIPDIFNAIAKSAYSGF